MGIAENNLFRKDIDEAAELAGIDFLINTTTNLRGESAAVFAGHWQQAYDAAVKDAVENYSTPKTTGHNIVISNSFAKSSESVISLANAIPLVSHSGGDIVIIANAPDGQVTHYLVGIFGKATYACQFTACSIPDNVHRVIVYNEFPHRGSSWFEDHPKISYLSRWSDVLKVLEPDHGPGTKVAVIPDATNQYFDWYR
jgi:nickel-dependent lactate racemase